eukprot:1157665-Pelagomonas_calceolata.AAC.10
MELSDQGCVRAYPLTVIVIEPFVIDCVLEWAYHGAVRPEGELLLGLAALLCVQMSVAGQGHPPGRLLAAARPRPPALPQHAVCANHAAGDCDGAAAYAQHAAGALRPQVVQQLMHSTQLVHCDLKVSVQGGGVL